MLVHHTTEASHCLLEGDKVLQAEPWLSPWGCRSGTECQRKYRFQLPFLWGVRGEVRRHRTGLVVFNQDQSLNL